MNLSNIYSILHPDISLEIRFYIIIKKPQIYTTNVSIKFPQSIINFNTMKS